MPHVSGEKVKHAVTKHAVTTLARFVLGAVIAIGSFAVHADEIVLAVARIPFSLPLFVADAEGYFAAEGQKVRLLDCPTGRRCLQHLFDGDAQLATVAETPLVFASFSRADFVVLASFVKSSNDIKVVARKSAGISAPINLGSQRIGVVIGTSSHYFLDSFLLYHGMDNRSVRVTGWGIEDLVRALQNREVDAIAAFEPSAYQAMRALGADALVFRAPRIYTTTFNLVAGRSFAQNRDADLIKILRAIDRAERFIQAEPQKAQAILRRKLELDQSFIDWVWSDLDYSLSLDQSLVKTLESEARWALREGYVNGKRPADYLDYIHPMPLKKAAPGAVTLIK